MASDGQDNQPSRLRLGARPFASRPDGLPASIPGRSYDAVSAPPFAVPVQRPPASSVLAPLDPDSAITPGPVPAVAMPTAGVPAVMPPVDDGLEFVRRSLDEELTHFSLTTAERPRTPVPFPTLDPAMPNDSALYSPGEPDDTEGDQTAGSTDVALREPGDREFAPLWTDASREEGRALDEALWEARDVVHRDELAQALEGIARRIRNGEIIVARDGLRRNDAGMLAAVLATLLGDRS
jgi:hypothetical protein